MLRRCSIEGDRKRPQRVRVSRSATRVNLAEASFDGVAMSKMTPQLRLQGLKLEPDSKLAQEVLELLAARAQPKLRVEHLKHA